MLLCYFPSQRIHTRLLAPLQSMNMFYLCEFGDFSAKFRWEYDRFFYDRWCREAYATLKNHPERTTQRQEAKVLVISATLRCVSFAGIRGESLFAMIRDAVLTNTSTPHVVFDLTDSPQPLFQAPNLIICKSAFHRQLYSPEWGVPIPQFPRYQFNGPGIPASRRRHIAGFKGNLRAEYGDLRKRLLELDDGKEFVFKSAVFRPETLSVNEDGVVSEVRVLGDQSHSELMENSTFAVLPRGCGYALSYRMVEAMNAGCVPVIISDGYVLPFEDLIDYDSFAVLVREADISRLPALLKLRLSDADALQRKSYAVYQRYFASIEKIIDTSIRQALERSRAFVAKRSARVTPL